MPYASQTSIFDLTQTSKALVNRTYQHINNRLYGGKLSPCDIGFKHLPRAEFHFLPNKLRADDGSNHHQLLFGSDNLIARSERAVILSLGDASLTQWQYEYGNPGRGTYRNRERAEKAKDIGLYPSNTGHKDGKETGESIGYYLLQGSPFQRLLDEIRAAGFAIRWEEVIPEKAATDSKGGKHVKYVCPVPDCPQYGRSNHSARLKCAVHDQLLKPQP